MQRYFYPQGTDAYSVIEMAYVEAERKASRERIRAIIARHQKWIKTPDGAGWVNRSLN